MLFTSETGRLHGDPTGARLAGGASRCSWCGAYAMRGQLWCNGHRPGPRKGIRGPGRRTTMSHRPLLARVELSVADTFPPPLLAWPPVRRIMETRPGFRDALGLRHIALALVAEAMGDGTAWPSVAGMLRESGFLKPSDPPRPRVLVPLDPVTAGAPRAPTRQVTGQVVP